MRVCLFASMALLAASPLLVAACGGGAGDASGAKAPEAMPAASAPPPAEPVTSSTTTLTLADGGDLIGSKLETKTTTVIPASSTAPTKAGPDATGPHKGEPGRTVDDVRAIIGSRRDEFRACYDKGLATHPGIQGDVDVKWVINPKGDVTDVSIDEMKSSISEPGTRQCIVDIIKKIKFAESPKGFESRMHYPFNFNPRSGGKTK